MRVGSTFLNIHSTESSTAVRKHADVYYAGINYQYGYKEEHCRFQVLKQALPIYYRHQDLIIMEMVASGMSAERATLFKFMRGELEYLANNLENEAIVSAAEAELARRLENAAQVCAVLVIFAKLLIYTLG
jgi:hypothetical protein